MYVKLELNQMKKTDSNPVNNRESNPVKQGDSNKFKTVKIIKSATVASAELPILITALALYTWAME